MANWHSDATDKLCDALLLLESREECYAFLEDICTIKEILEISQRLSVAELLSEKTSYNVISSETGASTATISRVAKCIDYGTGGYKKILDKLKEKEN